MSTCFCKIGAGGNPCVSREHCDKWRELQAQLLESQGELTVAIIEQRDQGYSPYSGTVEMRADWRARCRAFAEAVKSLKGKVKRLENKLADLEGPPVHHDIFGQELKVGVRVAWSTSGRTAGAHMGYVNRVTHKMVQVGYKLGAGYGSNVFPKNLIVVDLLVAAQEAREEI